VAYPGVHFRCAFSKSVQILAYFSHSRGLQKFHMILLSVVQLRSQEFVSEGDKTGGLGTEVPQCGPGAEPWWGSGG